MKLIINKDQVVLDPSSSVIKSPSLVGSVKVSTEVFLNELKKDSHLPPSGFLPPALRWISSDGLGVVFERPPFILDTVFSQANYGQENFDIPIPWTVYVIQFSPGYETIVSCRVFVRDMSLWSMDAPLFVPPFPNFYHDCRPCFGEAFYSQYAASYNNKKQTDPDTPWTLADALNVVLATFWSFNMNNEVWDWLERWRLPGCIPDAETGWPKNDESAWYQAIPILKIYQSLSLVNMLKQNFAPANPFGDNDNTLGNIINKTFMTQPDLLAVPSFNSVMKAFNAAKLHKPVPKALNDKEDESDAHQAS